MDAHEAIRQLFTDVKRWQRESRMAAMHLDCDAMGLTPYTMEQYTAQEDRVAAARRKASESASKAAKLLGAAGETVWRFVSLIEPLGDAGKAEALWPEVFANLNVYLNGNSAVAGKKKAGRKNKTEADSLTLVVSALCTWHKYGGTGIVGRTEPATMDELEALSKRSKPSITRALRAIFCPDSPTTKPYKAYESACCRELIGGHLMVRRCEMPSKESRYREESDD